MQDYTFQDFSRITITITIITQTNDLPAHFESNFITHIVYISASSLDISI